MEAQRKEFKSDSISSDYIPEMLWQNCSCCRRIVELAVKEMEDSGYEFNKKQVGNVEQYALTIQNVIDIYAHRQIPKYREIHKRTIRDFCRQS
ncbi:hypothetical protein [Escherichia coli]|uniref:hypothetical protein n=1 Tax=Escherichia coli TaxID=562 RepID=UPI00295E265C|nr:hypothetical protein [Escherichia coli]